MVALVEYGALNSSALELYKVYYRSSLLGRKVFHKHVCGVAESSVKVYAHGVLSIRPKRKVGNYYFAVGLHVYFYVYGVGNRYTVNFERNFYGHILRARSGRQTKRCVVFVKGVFRAVISFAVAALAVINSYFNFGNIEIFAFAHIEHAVVRYNQILFRLRYRNFHGFGIGSLQFYGNVRFAHGFGYKFTVFHFYYIGVCDFIRKHGIRACGRKGCGRLEFSILRNTYLIQCELEIRSLLYPLATVEYAHEIVS